MQFTLMLCSASSSATDCVSMMTAAFAVEYRCGPMPARTPHTEDVEMMDPSPWGIITRAACLVPITTLFSSTPIVMS